MVDGDDDDDEGDDVDDDEDDNDDDDDSGVDDGDDNDDDELQICYETNSLVRLHCPNAAPLMFFENFNSLSCQNVPNQ